MNVPRLYRNFRQFAFAPACVCLASPFALAQGTSTPPPAADSGEEIVVLSPFEVKSGGDKGYYGANTMSGTRFNTKIEDLASSITIVTKGQMSDFAMLDINDVFMYTAGTEGTATFTDVVIDRNGSVSDNVQINPTQANRVRGIASANVAFNNIELQNRMPIDPIIIDALEISRGPNASVFGLGNPSGTVNQVGAAANLTRDFAQVGLRADDWSGWRQSLDVNRMLYKDKLAVRVSQVFNHEGFTRKPSGVDTERYNMMIKYRPFKNTTISAGYYSYHMYGNRPNALAPRDGISYWLQNGKPTWDPVTRKIKLNGTYVKTATGADAVYGATNGDYNGPDYFNSAYLGANHSQVFIDEKGSITNWMASTGVTGIGTATNPVPAAGVNPSGPGVQANRLLQISPIAGMTATNTTGKTTQPLFQSVGSITDKAIYDWSSINLSSPNRIWDKTEISTVQLDQIFLNTDTQTLAAQFTFLREDSERYQRNFIGIANDLGLSGLLTVDINENLIDGTPNPYFLRPYMSTDKPRTTYSPWRWDTYRGQAAYRFDFTQKKNLLKWLGWHQVTGYDEYKYRVNRMYSYRDVMTSNPSWIPAGLYRGNQSTVTGTPALIATTQSNFRYYVGDATGNNVDYAPAQFSYGTYPYIWGNADPTTRNIRTESMSLGLGASTDSTSGTVNLKRILKTYGGVVQSHFWNDSIITTLGARQDKVFDVFGRRNALGMINPDGLTFNYDLVDAWDTNKWTVNSGRTTNVQIVARPFKNIRWFSDAASRGGAGGFVADLLGDMSIGHNKSNSFLPEEPAEDLFLNKLPNSTGDDKSWTGRFDLFDGKVIVSVTRYDNTVHNTRNGDANTINQRVIRTDLPLVATTPARFMLYNVAGAFTPSAANYNRVGWIKATNPSFTQEQVQAELEKVMGMPTALMNELINPTLPIRATNDIQARGTEVEVNLNLTNYWTVAGAFSESETINRNVSKALQDWIDARMKIWPTIVDPLIGAPAAIGGIAPTVGNETAHLWWNQLYPSATQTAATNFEVFVRQPYAVIKALEGQSNPQFSKYNARVSTNLQLRGLTEQPLLKKFNVGGAIRWQSRSAIGYYGVQELPAIITDVDVNRPIWDKDHYYFDAFVGYKTKIFKDKVGMSIQLNVQNIQESGSLRKVAAYPNGVANTFRIVDPRKFILTATFDL